MFRAGAWLVLAFGLLGTSCLRRPAQLREDKPRFSSPKRGPGGEAAAQELSPTAGAASTPMPAKSQPRTPEEWGEEFFKKGDYARAVSALSEAVKKDQSSPKLWRNLGSAYALAEDYDNAILCFERALKRDPRDLKARYNLSLIHNFRGTPESLKKAESAALQGLQEDPGHGPLHASLGNIYADQARDDSALREYEKALEINPRDPITRFNKGALHYKQRDFKAAEAEYRRTLEVDPRDAEAAQNLAAIYILQGRLKEAEALNRWVISQRPRDEDTLENAYFNLGIVYDRQNKLEKALDMYRLALQVAPWDAAAYVNTAVILERLKRRREALAYWEKYQRLFPGSRRAKEIARRIELLRKLVKLEKEAKKAAARADDEGGESK